jgi:hypothetical protein
VNNSAEIYKDPPVLPVAVTVTRVGGNEADAPFRSLNGDYNFAGFSSFKPNKSPEEILREGSFGGTYYRDIVSSVDNVKYIGKEVLKDSVADGWVSGLKSSMLTSRSYDVKVNRYGVKCGGSLGMWESSGWISNVDPYGWFQWYCRFFSGRRCSDDDRQIQRWNSLAGLKGRFRSQLCGKIVNSGKKFDDASVSPVVRQTLLHWGFEVTEEKIQIYKKAKGIK